jgi:hypothetical protein
MVGVQLSDNDIARDRVANLCLETDSYRNLSVTVFIQSKVVDKSQEYDNSSDCG